MKLLVVTQKVNQNDPILGFFHKWIEEFAKQVEQVTVICLEKGKYDLPANVKVLSLGKEVGTSKSTQISRFYKYIQQEKNNYDTVFVHMNPEYVVLGGLFWKMWHKKVSLWYVHRQVNLKLRIATWWSNIIFTSAPESFGIKSPKVKYVGHGIDVSRFNEIPSASYHPLVIVHIGRVTPIKNIEVIIKAVSLLIEGGVDAKLNIVGEPVSPRDVAYKENLVSIIKSLGIQDRVTCMGTQENRQALSEASITVSATPDGGMDKAVLESLAAGRAAFVSNKIFKKIYDEDEDTFFYAFTDVVSLAEKVENFLKNPDKEKLIAKLSERVRKEYNVADLAQTMVGYLGSKC